MTTSPAHPAEETASSPSAAVPFVPAGRPVRRFVAVILVAAVVLVVTAIVGPFSARTEVWISAWQVEDDQVTAVVALTNTGRFPVDVEGFHADELATVLPLREHVPVGDEFIAGDPLGSVRIDPGETVNVAVVVTCADRADTARADISLDRPAVDVSVALGLTRVARAEWATSFGTECPTA